MPLTPVDGVDVYYRATAGPAPLVVFVHGYCCRSADWAAQLADLGRDHAVAAPDLIGHGRSGAGTEPWTIGANARAVGAVLDASGPGPVVLVGHSMGCRIALQTALNRPDRVAGIVLVDGSWTGPGDPAVVVPAIRDRIAAMGARRWIVDSFERMFLPGADEQLRARLLARAATAPLQAATELLPDMFGWDAGRMAGTLAQLRVPVLAVQSTDLDDRLLRVAVRTGDRTRWLDLLADRVRDLRVVTVPARSHFPMLERPDLVSAAVADFAAALAR